jgi:hypothetical protein
MGEEIIAAGFRRDETKTLGIVEPLDCTCCHVLNILKKIQIGDGPSRWGETQDSGVMKGKDGGTGNRITGTKPDNNGTT